MDCLPQAERQRSGRIQPGAERICRGQYIPFEVSTQVVAGTNYRFKCKSTVPLAKPIHGEAVVQIFQSLDGSAHITSITPI